MLKGIDISKWQKGINLDAIKTDFVIAKATEGIGYVDPTCDRYVQWCIKNKKQFGFYHFARTTNDPIAEAQFYVKNTRNYFEHGLPVLDYEGTAKNPPKASDVEWCRKWMVEVHRLTGVLPVFYTYEALEHQFDWSPVADLRGKLWLAKYPPMSRIIHNYNFSMCVKPTPKHWRVLDMIMWQFAGDNGRVDGYNGGIDCDVFYGGVETWLELSAKTLLDTTEHANTDEKDNEPINTPNKELLAEIERLKRDLKTSKEKNVKMLSELKAIKKIMQEYTNCIDTWIAESEEN